MHHLCFRKEEGEPIISRPQQSQFKINSAAVVISPGSVFKLPVMIPRGGTNVEWSFSVKDYSCWFGVASKVDPSPSDYIVVQDRPTPNTETKGSVLVEEACTIYLIWDNSSSWIRSKTVIYSLTLDVPKDVIEEKQRAYMYFEDYCY